MTPIAKTRLALSVGRYVLTGFAAGVSAFSFSQSYAVQGWLGSTTDLTAGQSTAVPGLPAGMTFLIPLAALLALSAPALLAGRTGLFKWFAALCLVAHAPALLAHATVDWGLPC